MYFPKYIVMYKNKLSTVRLFCPNSWYSWLSHKKPLKLLEIYLFRESEYKNKRLSKPTHIFFLMRRSKQPWVVAVYAVAINAIRWEEVKVFQFHHTYELNAKKKLGNKNSHCFEAFFIWIHTSSWDIWKSIWQIQPINSKCRVLCWFLVNKSDLWQEFCVSEFLKWMIRLFPQVNIGNTTNTQRTTCLASLVRKTRVGAPHFYAQRINILW